MIVVTTIDDEIAEDTDLQTQGSDGTGLSLREAIAIANATEGADVITFDESVLGQLFNTTENGTVNITDDTTIIGEIDILFETRDPIFEISNGASVTFSDFSLTHTPEQSGIHSIIVAGDNVSLTNDADIIASLEGTMVREVVIDVRGNNFTLVNETGGSIVTNGRYAIRAISGEETTYVTNIINHGLIESSDDAVHLTSGIITNSGTIRTTHLFDFGNPRNTPGENSEAIFFFGAIYSNYVTPDYGQGVVNNLSSGIIEGGRSAVVLPANGVLNNDGFITAEVFAIRNHLASEFLAPAPLVINNSGIILRDGLNYGNNNFLTDDGVSTILLRSTTATSSIEINNSGTISSPDMVISISRGGATVNNSNFGQILSDTDMAGNDGIAFRGAKLDDYRIERYIYLTATYTEPGDVYDNTQGITVIEVQGMAQLLVPGVGSFSAISLQVNTADIPGSDNPLLPLIDIEATRDQGALVFEYDENGFVYPATIDIETSYGTLTVKYVSGSGFTITDANGDIAYEIPQDVDFADTIINSGLFDGDITTGLGNDMVINTGTINGNIFLGDGDDMVLGDEATSLTLSSAEGQLFRAFQAVFDRAPDEGGFNAFLTEMRLGNTTQEAVISEFVSSTEFQNTYGTLNNQGFVEQLFRNVLDREGDTGGITAFTNELNAGRSRESVVTEFANSAEFVQLMSVPSAAFATNVIVNPAEAQVFRIFQAVFQRDPDEGGFTAFTNSIQAGVLTVEEITAEFVGSAEFQQTYGNLENAEFVELLFTNVLPGNTDAAGRASFTAALDASTLTRADMVAEFVNSFEFVQRMSAPAEAFVASTFTSSGNILSGGTGNDVLFGGRGADSFVFDTQGGGQDTVLDFTSGTDTLDLGTNADFDSFDEIMAVGTQVGQDTVFDFGDGNTLTLDNVTLSELTEADFGILIMG